MSTYAGPLHITPQPGTLMGRPIAEHIHEPGESFFTSKPREVGNVIAKIAPDAVIGVDLEEKARTSAEVFFARLKKHCRQVVWTEPEIVPGPNTDVFNRWRAVGWRAVWGSPDADFFEELFKCRRQHREAVDAAELGRVFREYLRTKLYPRRVTARWLYRLANLVNDYDRWEDR